METFAPIFNGFYGTAYEFETDNYSIMDDFFSEYDDSNAKKIITAYIMRNYDDVIDENYEGYRKDVAEKVCDFLTEKVSEMLKVKTTFIFESIYSPKFYNFSNDSINVKIDTDTDKFMNSLMSFINNHIEQFKEYIKENYTSYDGFLSYYSNDYKQWLKNEYNEHEIGSMLEFALRTYYDDIETDMMYYILENIYVNAYVSINKEFEQLLNDSRMLEIFKEYDNLCTMKQNYIEHMEKLGKKPNYKAINEHDEVNIQSLCDEIENLMK